MRHWFKNTEHACAIFNDLLTPEARETLGRQNLTKQDLIDLPLVDITQLNKHGVYVTTVERSDGTFGVYTGSGTDQRGLIYRIFKYASVKNAGFVPGNTLSARDATSRHLRFFFPEDAILHVRVIAIADPRSVPVSTATLEGVLQIYMKCIGHPADLNHDFSPQCIRPFIDSHGAPNVNWPPEFRPLNMVCALKQGVRNAYGTSTVCLAGCGVSLYDGTNILPKPTPTGIGRVHHRCLRRERRRLAYDHPEKIEQIIGASCARCWISEELCSSEEKCKNCRRWSNECWYPGLGQRPAPSRYRLRDACEACGVTQRTEDCTFCTNCKGNLPLWLDDIEDFTAAVQVDGDWLNETDLLQKRIKITMVRRFIYNRNVVGVHDAETRGILRSAVRNRYLKGPMICATSEVRQNFWNESSARIARNGEELRKGRGKGKTTVLKGSHDETEAAFGPAPAWYSEMESELGLA